MRRVICGAIALSVFPDMTTGANAQGENGYGRIRAVSVVIRRFLRYRAARCGRDGEPVGPPGRGRAFDRLYLAEGFLKVFS